MLNAAPIPRVTFQFRNRQLLADVLHHLPNSSWKNVIHKFSISRQFPALLSAPKTVACWSAASRSEIRTPKRTGTQKSSEIINHKAPAYHFDWINFSSDTYYSCCLPSYFPGSRQCQKICNTLFLLFCILSHSVSIRSRSFEECFLKKWLPRTISCFLDSGWLRQEARSRMEKLEQNEKNELICPDDFPPHLPFIIAGLLLIDRHAVIVTSRAFPILISSCVGWALPLWCKLRKEEIIFITFTLLIRALFRTFCTLLAHCNAIFEFSFCRDERS